MKPLYLVCVIAILFTSCSDWRYSNGIKWKQSEYRSSDQAETKTASPEKVKAEVLSNTTVTEEKLEEVSAVQAEENNSPSVKEEKTEILENAAFKSSEMARLEGDDDSTARDSEIVEQAMKAEKNGKKSMIFGIIGLAMVFFPPFLIGLVFSIIALAKGIKSLNQRYNTPKGLKYAKVGVILSSIALVLSLLVIFVFVLLILFL